MQIPRIHHQLARKAFGFLTPLFAALVSFVCVAPTGQPAGAGAGPKVIAYYFHVTVRCATCRTIENYSREAIEQGFARELRGGALEWRPINVQLQENRHFVQEYRLYTRSLVLVKMRDGKQVEWRNLEKVWDFVGDKSQFLKYVQSNVKTYLGGS